MTNRRVSVKVNPCRSGGATCQKSVSCTSRVKKTRLSRENLSPFGQSNLHHSLEVASCDNLHEFQLRGIVTPRLIRGCKRENAALFRPDSGASQRLKLDLPRWHWARWSQDCATLPEASPLVLAYL